jgi:hypothetical protein
VRQRFDGLLDGDGVIDAALGKCGVGRQPERAAP